MSSSESSLERRSYQSSTQEEGEEELEHVSLHAREAQISNSIHEAYHSIVNVYIGAAEDTQYIEKPHVSAFEEEWQVSDAEDSINEQPDSDSLAIRSCMIKPFEYLRRYGYVPYSSVAKCLESNDPSNEGHVDWFLEHIHPDEKTTVFQGKKIFKKNGGGGGGMGTTKSKDTGPESVYKDLLYSEDEEDDNNDENQDGNSKNKTMGPSKPHFDPYIRNIYYLEQFSIRNSVMNDICLSSRIIHGIAKQFHDAYKVYAVSLCLKRNIIPESELEELSYKIATYYLSNEEHYRLTLSKYKCWMLFYMKNYQSGLYLSQKVGKKGISGVYSSYAKAQNQQEEEEEEQDKDFFFYDSEFEKRPEIESESIHFYSILSKLQMHCYELYFLYNDDRIFCHVSPEFLNKKPVVAPWCVVSCHDTEIFEYKEQAQEDKCKQYPHKCQHLTSYIPHKETSGIIDSSLVLFHDKDWMQLSVTRCIQLVNSISSNIMHFCTIKKTDEKRFACLEYTIQMLLYRLAYISNVTEDDTVFDHPEYRVIVAQEQNDDDDDDDDLDDRAEHTNTRLYRPSFKWLQFASVSYYVLHAHLDSRAYLLPHHYRIHSVLDHFAKVDKTTSKQSSPNNKKSAPPSPASDRSSLQDATDDAPNTDTVLAGFAHEYVTNAIESLVAFLKGTISKNKEAVEAFCIDAVKRIEEDLVLPGMNTWVPIRNSQSIRDEWNRLSDGVKNYARIMQTAMPGAADMILVYMSRFQYFSTYHDSQALFFNFVEKFLRLDFTKVDQFRAQFLDKKNSQQQQQQHYFFDSVRLSQFEMILAKGAPVNFETDKQIYKSKKDVFGHSFDSSGLSLVNQYTYVGHLLQYSLVISALNELIEDCTNKTDVLQDYIISFHELISLDIEDIYMLENTTDAYIVQVDMCTYSVYYLGHFYDCGSSLLRAAVLWLHIYHKYKKGIVRGRNGQRLYLDYMINTYITRPLLSSSKNKTTTMTQRSSSSSSSRRRRRSSNKIVFKEDGMCAGTGFRFPQRDQREVGDVYFDSFGFSSELRRNPISRNGTRKKSTLQGDSSDEEDSERNETQSISASMLGVKTDAMFEKDPDYTVNIEDLIDLGKFDHSMAHQMTHMFGMISNPYVSYSGEIGEKLKPQKLIESIKVAEDFERANRRDKTYMDMYQRDVAERAVVQRRYMGDQDPMYTTSNKQQDTEMYAFSDDNTNHHHYRATQQDWNLQEEEEEPTASRLLLKKRTAPAYDSYNQEAEARPSKKARYSF